MSVAEHFNALVARDLEEAARQADDLRRAFLGEGILFAGSPMATFLRPHFVPRHEWDELRIGSRRILEIASRASRTIFDGDLGRLFDFLGTPGNEADLVRLDSGGPDCVLSRIDAFQTPSGPRFIEINSDAPAGFGYGDRMAEVFERLPLLEETRKTNPLEYVPSGGELVESVLKVYRRLRGPGVPRVGILDWRDVKTRPDQEILRALFIKRGAPCDLLDPRDLRLDGRRLLGPTGSIDVVYRRLVLSEIAGREGEVKAFLEAYRSGHVVFVNSFRCRLAEDKAIFAVMTDEAFASLFDPEERAFLERVLPWTRRIAERKTRRGGEEVDLVPHVLEKQQDLVLKPSHGYGGASVVLGSEATPAEWEKAVLAGLEAPVVVQERVPIPEEVFPVLEGGEVRLESRKVNVNPFYALGVDVGAVTRASLSSVINVSAGGGSVPTFVAD
jgi:hypothetical protein